MIADTHAPDANSIRSRKRARLRVFRLIAVFISFIAALAIVEAALRVIERASAVSRTPTIVADPQLGHRIPSNAPGHDARGFRNSGDISQADVVAVGDSQTWGINVQADNAWPQQLARLSGRTVYNMGVGGYGPDRYMLLSNRALQLHPQTMA